MSDVCLRLAYGVSIEPTYGDIDVDCRLLFIGDRYRLLQRAYAEAMFRLSKPRSLDEREASLRSSAEVLQFYEVIRQNGTIALHMRDEIFRGQAPLDDLDLTLTAAGKGQRVGTPLPLTSLKAAGVLVASLNGALPESGVLAQLHTSLDPDDAAWAAALLAGWSDAGLLERVPAAPNAFEWPGRPRVTFLGHSSLLLQSKRSAVLTDPVLRARFGVPSASSDVVRLKLGAICCSHSHWDHCDAETLLRFDKQTTIVVPRVRTPTAFNPPIVPLLQHLGFTDIREVDVWDTVRIDDIEIVAVPFHGEQDEPGAEIDHYTYVLRTEGLSVYGGVDAYRDTFGEMLPALERVRREWTPDIAFLPVSRLKYSWREGGVSGYCRDVNTDLLDQWFQYTASPEQAAEWARTLGARRFVPYATFTFSPFAVAPEALDFERALKAGGLGALFLPLRPFDSAEPMDLSDTGQSTMRRQYLSAFLRAGVAAKRLDSLLKTNPGYRLVKRVLRRQAPVAEHHDH